MKLSEALAKIPQLQEAQSGTQCRIELTIEKADEGYNIKSAKYISSAGKKTKEEYLNMDDKQREEYDKEDLDIDEDKEEKED